MPKTQKDHLKELQTDHERQEQFMNRIELGMSKIE